ncbi:glucokinase [Alteromonas oceanisediminis]|uniref:glucokinase n=1 Tax=Alteromonas oceanisediminis TaxID=2836180 RepID=UPI001BDA94C5|nr:glucokinase [Alteromonas oceanisediminis]MBT0586559.1 glucokinase [Alteromonas oceanisediminis]
MAAFVADVGGTNIRLAVLENGELSHIKKYLCADFDSIALAIQRYFDDTPEHTFSSGCIAIACPTHNDWVKMTNHSWQFSKQQLQAHFGLDWLGVINDFTAVAHSLPVLQEHQLVQLGAGARSPTGNIAVFGPGTGLGVEHMTMTPAGWQTLDGEGGHVDFAPGDETDVIIWRYLFKQYGRASAEEVMSGRGIVNIYRALAEHAGVDAVHSQAAEITQAAADSTCAVCVQTVQQFCRILGHFAGNLALNLATTGGVFIGGGIALRLLDVLQQGDFRRCFERKGQFEHYVKPIPTFLISEPDHGLLGAGAYLTQQTASL